MWSPPVLLVVLLHFAHVSPVLLCTFAPAAQQRNRPIQPACALETALLAAWMQQQHEPALLWLVAEDPHACARAKWMSCCACDCMFCLQPAVRQVSFRYPRPCTDCNRFVVALTILLLKAPSISSVECYTCRQLEICGSRGLVPAIKMLDLRCPVITFAAFVGSWSGPGGSRAYVRLQL